MKQLQRTAGALLAVLAACGAEPAGLASETTEFQEDVREQVAAQLTSLGLDAANADAWRPMSPILHWSERRALLFLVKHCQSRHLS